MGKTAFEASGQHNALDAMGQIVDIVGSGQSVSLISCGRTVVTGKIHSVSADYKNTVHVRVMRDNGKLHDVTWKFSHSGRSSLEWLYRSIGWRAYVASNGFISRVYAPGF